MPVCHIGSGEMFTGIIDLLEINVQNCIPLNCLHAGLQFDLLGRFETAKAKFDFLQKKLAEFKDSNKNISTARFMSELQKLETEYQLQENILITLASEYNNNKIKLNKDTPIFSVIDEVSIPNQRSKPQRSLIVITYVFLGLVLSVGFILAKEPIIDLVKEIIE